MQHILASPASKSDALEVERRAISQKVFALEGGMRALERGIDSTVSDMKGVLEEKKQLKQLCLQLRQDNSRLRDQRTQLQQQLVAATHFHTDTSHGEEAANAEIAGSYTDSSRLREAHDSAALVGPLHDKIFALEQKEQFLEGQLRLKESLLEGAQARLEESERMRQDSRAQAFQANNTEAYQLRSALSQLEAENAELKSEKEAMEEAFVEYKKQLDTLGADHQTKIESLAMVVAEKERLEAEKRALLGQIETLAQQIAKLQSHVETHSPSKLSPQMNGGVAKMGKLEASVQALTLENHRLQQQLASAQDELRNSKIHTEKLQLEHKISAQETAMEYQKLLHKATTTVATYKAHNDQLVRQTKTALATTRTATGRLTKDLEAIAKAVGGNQGPAALRPTKRRSFCCSCLGFLGRCFVRLFVAAFLLTLVGGSALFIVLASDAKEFSPADIEWKLFFTTLYDTLPPLNETLLQFEQLVKSIR